jgi:DNA (cytosine-5)-methyltransferase 1
MAIPIVDLFAGPGGLNEGFASVRSGSNEPVFEIATSIEMNPVACATLRLRSAFRTVAGGGGSLDPYYEFLRGERSFESLQAIDSFREALQHASQEVHEIELGLSTRARAKKIIGCSLELVAASNGSRPWILIGGPPCQAYSLAGRSRRANDATFEEDKKHFLYREYLSIIQKFRPTIFVMENVKGLLSSTNAGQGTFDRILRDLAGTAHGPQYEIHSLVTDLNDSAYSPGDFVIRSERFGIPQRRHRVILLGILKGSGFESKSFKRLSEDDPISTIDAIGDLPKLRSGISRFKGDDSTEWFKLRNSASKVRIPASKVPGFAAREIVDPLLNQSLDRGALFVAAMSAPNTGTRGSKKTFRDWVQDSEIGGVIQHESRTHMVEDLRRYWFAAAYGQIHSESPKLRNFPKKLLPNHANASSDLRPFEDRFRVQLADLPSTTVVSHIAKDGHYYIHPDPLQMRSLTVREAARLQTFPDSYYFWGNRTEQYTQVGNAVPPLLAKQIAEIVSNILS